MSRATPQWQALPILSGHTARQLASAPDGPVALSLDLGRTTAQVSIGDGALILPDGTTAPLGQDLSRAFTSDEDCAVLRDGGWEKLYEYSESTGKYYKLYQAVEGQAPTIVIAGATMHTIVGKAPMQDAADKVAALPRRIRGACLDTCCGLGYSAQLLSDRIGGPVTTCELDPNVLEMAALNPWSEGLFDPSRVSIDPRDLRDVVAECGDGTLGCIFHDPPTVHQAGELYAESLYVEFARILARGGVLYHYVGTPGKRRRGQDYAAGVMRRMASAGFTRTKRVWGGVLGRCTVG
jgi:uncharacterized protein